MKIFAYYTLARVGLFLGVYALIWLVFGSWLTWDSLSALYTALLAMIVSSLIALTALRGLRGQLAVEVDKRARRAKQAFDDRKAAEDDAKPTASETDDGPSR